MHARGRQASHGGCSSPGCQHLEQAPLPLIPKPGMHVPQKIPLYPSAHMLRFSEATMHAAGCGHGNASRVSPGTVPASTAATTALSHQYPSSNRAVHWSGRYAMRPGTETAWTLERRPDRRARHGCGSPGAGGRRSSVKQRLATATAGRVGRGGQVCWGERAPRWSTQNSGSRLDERGRPMHSHPTNRSQTYPRQASIRPARLPCAATAWLSLIAPFLQPAARSAL